MREFRALTAALLLGLSHLAWGEELNFFNWAEYMDPSILEDFTRETGIKVNYTLYESNEELYEKLTSGDGSYDLAVPSTYYVGKLTRENLLLPLDKTKLPGLNNLYRALLGKSADPSNKYSVPYLWGTTGIVVDAKVIDPGKVKRWSDLWNKQYRGKVLMLDEMREVFHVGLRALGYSSNSPEPAEIRAAAKMLASLAPNVKAWDSETPQARFAKGEVAIGMLWNGEAYKASKANPNLHYIYPEEGAVMWMDTLVIPSTARNIDAAHKMIDFLLRPDIAVRLSVATGYATPNKAAIRKLPDDIRNNTTIYPPESALEKAEFIYDVGTSAALYEEAWTQLRK